MRDSKFSGLVRRKQLPICRTGLESKVYRRARMSSPVQNMLQNLFPGGMEL